MHFLEMCTLASSNAVSFWSIVVIFFGAFHNCLLRINWLSIDRLTRAMDTLRIVWVWIGYCSSRLGLGYNMMDEAAAFILVSFEFFLGRWVSSARVGLRRDKISTARASRLACDGKRKRIFFDNGQADSRQQEKEVTARR